ncbi:2-phosphoglycolate phosphatase [Flagelloscypha sp. PMI_526]|nr:2-phosphoglycolate phosphatase [Flagelloscypha sp. PMI_526]
MLSYLQEHDTWMFDCDGVLWQGDHLVPGAKEVLQLLRAQKKQVLFVTNNATKSRRAYKKKFDDLGIEAHVDEIYGSAYASAVYLSSVVKFPKDKKVYVIGMKGLEEELEEEGIAHVGGTNPDDITFEPFSFADYIHDDSVGAVLCGLDTNINYTKLSKAYQYLTRNPGCLFLSTNIDSTYPVNGGKLPGAGSMMAPLRFSLGKDPLSIGKPNKTMLDCIQANSLNPEKTIMVGDRLNTDILFGQAGGVHTLLVLTGITQVEEVEGPNPSEIVPDYITNSIADLQVLEETVLEKEMGVEKIRQTLYRNRGFP